MDGEFRIGPWLVQPSLDLISRDGLTVHLEPKVMEVLVCLAQRAGEPVGKEELMEAVWPGTFVTDDALKRCVFELRRAFDDDAREPRIIETIPKRGYRLVALVEPVKASGTGAERAPQPPLSASTTGTERRKQWMIALAFTVLAAVIWGATRYRPNQGSPIDSLAVLPFANNNMDANGELLGDGITSGLIESLSQIPHLKVTSRSAVSHYKGREVDPRTVGRELNVKALLIGRMVQRGGGFVLDAELVNASDGSHIWGQQYEGKPSGALTLQMDVARAVSEKLRPRLTSDAKAKLVNPGTSNSEAYSLYVKGRYFADRWDPQNWKKALASFQQAVEKDRTYPQAHAGVGEAYAVVTFYGFLPRGEGIEKAKAAAHRALGLDGNLAEAHCALGVASYVDWEWEEAEAETRRCVELNPNLVFAHQYYAWTLESKGKMEQGLAEQRIAVEFDPVSVVGNEFLGETYYWLRDYDRAIQQLQKSIELDPNLPDLHDYLGDCYAMKGEYDKAALAYQEGLRLRHEHDQAKNLHLAYVKDGYRGLLKAQIRLWSDAKKLDDYDPSKVAGNYSLLRDSENAFLWLDRAYAERDKQVGGLLLPIQIEQFFDNIRSDPRYKAFLRRMGFPE